MRRKSRRRSDEVDYDESDWGEPRSRRWRFRWLLLLVLLGVAVWFVPHIVTRPTVLNKILAQAAPELVGRLSYDQASAGWLAPIQFRNVTVLDLQDQPLFEAAEITTERSLLGLITNRTHAGKVALRQPRVLLTIGPDGTNLQELLDAISSPSEEEASEESTSPPTGIAIEIVDGQVVCRDLIHATEYRIDDLDLQLDYAGAADRPTTIELAALTAAAPTAGRANISAQWQPAGQELADLLGTGDLRFEIDDFPLGLLEPIFRQLGTDLQANGLASGTLLGRWNTTPQGLGGHLKGELGIANLVCASPSYLGTDQIRAAKTEVHIETELANNVLDVRGLNVNSDFGHAEIVGVVPLDELLKENGVNIWKTIAQIDSLRWTGTMDLVRLSKTLPTTLHIREGTELTDGQITWELTSDGSVEAKNIRAIVQTAQLSGLSDGQSISWSTPIQVSLQGVVSPRGLEIRELSGQSGFLQLRGTGTPTAGNIALNANLRDLSDQIGQIVDFGNYQLDGSLESQIVWQQDEAGALQTKADLVLTQLQVISPQTTPWREERLEISVTAQAMVLEDQISRIDVARVELNAQQDQLDVVLVEPLVDLADDPRGTVSIRIRGDAQSWMSRLGPWLPLADWTVQGSVDAETTATVSANFVSANELRIEMSDLQAKGPGYLLVEPAIKIEGQAQWDQTRRHLDVPWFTLASSTLALRAEPVELTMGETFSADGRVAFRGDLLGLWQLTQQPHLEAFRRPTGQIKGKIQFTTDQDVIQFNGSSTVDNLVYEVRASGKNPIAIMTVAGKSPWAPMWRESAVKLTSQGTYDVGQEQLDLHDLLVESDSLSIQARGRIAGLLSNPHADLGGQLHYDLALAADKLKSQIGNTIRVSGRQSQPFSIRGPLKLSSVRVQPTATNPIAPINLQTTQTVSDELTADLTVGWDALKVLGIDIGPSQLSAQLLQGVISTTPVEFNVSGGRLLMSPRLDLNSTPKLLTLDGQSRADNIQITPEMSQAWLQYIAPWVAGAAVADGRLSVQLDRAVVPVDNPATGTVKGTLTIHQARIQPGPLAQQFIQITQQITQLLQIEGGLAARLRSDDIWLEISENRADFMMADGRVHHENLQFHVGEVTVRSSGWVGIDQTMGLVASIPIEDDWVDRRPELAGLRGQSIQIPISGTVTEPRLDQSAVTQISSQLIGGAAQGFLNTEIQKGLQKLFGN